MLSGCGFTFTAARERRIDWCHFRFPHWTYCSSTGSTPRHATLLFPKTNVKGVAISNTRQTMHGSTGMGALRRVVGGLQFTRNISVYCLCHSYATHLLEAGVNFNGIHGNCNELPSSR